jgi:hypothetical protein
VALNADFRSQYRLVELLRHTAVGVFQQYPPSSAAPIAIEWISSQTCTRVVVEIFDDHGVSFVSVTQPFNTTSSMGRLMLNVLLSFAQFEREVIGELYRTKRPSWLAIWKRR